MSDKSWNRPAPVVAEKPQATTALQPPEEAAEELHQLLMVRGWGQWRCSALGGDVIVVVIDELINGYPVGYPVYTLQELNDVVGLDDRLLRIAHEAKKELGAKVAGVEVISG